MISPEKRRIAYLKWKEKKKLRKEGLIPEPFKATSDEDRKWQKNKLQRERRVKQGITRYNNSKSDKPRPEPPIVLKVIKRAKKEKPKAVKLPTIKQDINQLIAVKIDSKTTIYVKKGKDIEQVKNKYLNR